MATEDETGGRRAPAVTRAPIGSTLLHLAWPVIAGEALHVAFHLVDLAWVRRLGPWATAAISSSMFTLWAALALTNLIGTGLTAHVSRAVGGGDRARAGRVVAQAVLLAVALSVAVGVVGLIVAPGLFALLTDDPLVARAGVGYLRVVAVGLPFTFVGMALAAALRAAGNTRLPLCVQGGAVLANMVLSPFLIYGWGPFPAWGVAGSAVATVVCLASSTLVLAVLALRGHRDLPLEIAGLRAPDPGAMWAIARVGAPHAAIGVLFSLVYLWYARLAGAEGAAALALLGIGNRLESITYLTADGFGVAAATFVGQNLGAGQAERAERGAQYAVRMVAAMGLLVTAAMASFPRALLLPFTADPMALDLGVTYLRILALCQVPTALEGAIGGVFAGAGDTVPPMVIHVSFALIRIPLATLAVPYLGGLWAVLWTMTVTCCLRGVVLVYWFRRGRWKERQLEGFAAPLPAAEGPDASV